MTLRIGPIEVSPPVVLAPMAGVTNPPFRILCREVADAGVGVLVSEMVTARGLVEGGDKSWKLVRFADHETPRSTQLYGVDPATMAEAVRLLIGEVGVDHIDLNFGCPVPKVTRKGGGAALPLHHVLLGRIIGAAVRAAEPHGVPVTVKFRLGVDAEHLTHLATGRIAEAEGAAAVALHARTAEQHYSGRAEWSAIADLKRAVTTIPVLGNGDIWAPADAVAMMAETGCDGVVVGRGCLGRPWLFRDLADELAGRPIQPSPPVEVVVGVMRRHVDLLEEWLGAETAVRDFRKHVGWYLAGYPVGPSTRRSASTAPDLPSLRGALDRIAADFGGLTQVPGTEALPRGKVSGPRKVVLPAGWLDTLDDPAPPHGAELLTSGG